MSVCSVKLCDRSVHGQGYCKAHYLRFWRHGKVLADISIGDMNKPKECLVFGCSRGAKSKGYCRQHYARYWKKRAIMYLGGVCSNCNFSDIRALQFDHINGGGESERYVGGTGRGSGFYRQIALGNRSDIQLLCANCNWIKRFENGEHS